MVQDKKQYKLINGDCLKVMQNIPDNSIDLILCDLPYGTTECHWDAVIPFDLLWEQYKRIIKDYSAIVLFGAEPFSTLLRHSNLQMYKYDWIWAKNRNVGHLQCKTKPLNDHELISVFSKGTMSTNSEKLMPYYPQGLRKINKMKSGKIAGKNDSVGHKYARKSHDKDIVLEYDNYPKKTLAFPSDNPVIHPTQKPIALLSYLIKTYTVKNGLVLDNTMGSGSTGVASVACGRRFIGIEKEEQYFNIAKTRIESVPRSLF